MSFFTSNSKQTRYKLLVALFLAIIIVGALATNCVLSIYESKRTTKNSYLNIITSKYQHMRLNHNPGDLDIVFIGSSRTQFNISSNYFKKQGLTSYNLSMLACFPLSFPNMIANAIEMNPKSIGLGIDLDYFYNKFEDRIPTPGLEDIKAQLATDLSKDIVFRTGIDYLEKAIPIARHSTTILTKIQSYLNPVAGKYFAAPNHVDKTAFNAPSTSIPSNEANVSFDADSKVFAIQKLSDSYYSVKCVNGDGILFGTTFNSTSSFPRPDANELTIQNENIKFVNYLLQNIKDHGIKPFIYLCAKMDSPRNYDLGELSSLLDCTVIDTVNVIPRNNRYWGDEGHLNNKGRLIYSEILMNKILYNNIIHSSDRSLPYENSYREVDR